MMNTPEQNNRFYWKKAANGGIEILRVFSSSPAVDIPPVIAGNPVTGLGNYCFAPDCPLPDGYMETAPSKDPCTDYTVTQLCGNNLVSIRLPDTLQSIGSYAFFNCRCLDRLEFAPSLQNIGSDAFMNCQKLQQLFLRCPPTVKTSLRQVLAQIPWNVEVTFTVPENTTLFYPEYDEIYDEIAPAHIFGRKIVGEGFRARQCFQNGIISFPDYDAIFPQTCVEEPEDSLCRIAFYRLRNPVGLSQQCRQQYTDFILSHGECTCRWLIQERKLQDLLFLFEHHLLPARQASASLTLAAQSGWSEGSAAILRLKQLNSRTSTKSNYTFEGF